MVVGVEELEAARGSSIINLSRDFKALSAACFKLTLLVVEIVVDEVTGMVVGVEELEAARGSSIISLSRDFKALSAACFKLS